MLSIYDMRDIVVDCFPEQKSTAEANTDDDGNLMGHIFASESISQPMMDLYYSDRKKYEKYCQIIELLWKEGDDNVQNIIDVTILEDLNNAGDEVWKGLGKHFSQEFKNYINKDLIHTNIAMCLVEI